MFNLFQLTRHQHHQRRLETYRRLFVIKKVLGELLLGFNRFIFEPLPLKLNARIEPCAIAADIRLC